MKKIIILLLPVLFLSCMLDENNTTERYYEKAVEYRESHYKDSLLCSNCDTHIRVSDNYCYNCGEEIKTLDN